ncbi:hypothetical protein [Conyzicola sp.]|uniref:hypothetical protein n=1 Tax=Conyzicola sp. TaxID=1969404 RepID=UPI003989E440
MVRGHHTRRIAALALVALAGATLAGCAAQPGAGAGGGADASLTLAQTKSPVQLLRNEAADRIDQFIVETVNETEDLSVACKTEEVDPLGLERSWTSSVEVSLKAGSAWRATIVADDLIASFEEQGWIASRAAPSAVTYTGLKSDASAATIGITVTNEDLATATPAKLQITTEGPCVTTAGAESDEVTKLETKTQ